MPVAATFPPSRRFAIMSITDPYCIEEWRATVTTLLASDVCRTHGKLLVDRRRATAPDTAFVTAMTEFFAAHRLQLAGKRAAIVVGDEAGFGMSRMTELRSQLDNPDATIRTFRDYDGAVRWLSSGATRLYR